MFFIFWFQKSSIGVFEMKELECEKCYGLRKISISFMPYCKIGGSIIHYPLEERDCPECGGGDPAENWELLKKYVKEKNRNNFLEMHE